MREMTRSKPQIQSAWLIGPDGALLVGDRFYPAPAANVSDRSFFQWHRDRKGGLFLSELSFGRVTRTGFFDMSRGRYGADGSFAGVASVSMAPEYFEKVHSDLAADEPGLAINMLREDGTIFSRWPVWPTRPPGWRPTAP